MALSSTSTALKESACTTEYKFIDFKLVYNSVTGIWSFCQVSNFCVFLKISFKFFILPCERPNGGWQLCHEGMWLYPPANSQKDQPAKSQTSRISFFRYCHMVNLQNKNIFAFFSHFLQSSCISSSLTYPILRRCGLEQCLNHNG